MWRWQATLNDGIVECWPPARRAKSLRLGENTGYDKRKKIYSTKNVASTCYDDARQTSIFCFRPRKYATITRKSIQIYSFWFFKPTISIFSPSRRVYEPEARAHYSIVPSFQLRSAAELSSLWVMMCVIVRYYATVGFTHRQLRFDMAWTLERMRTFTYYKFPELSKI